MHTFYIAVVVGASTRGMNGTTRGNMVLISINDLGIDAMVEVHRKAIGAALLRPSHYCCHIAA